jgi:signal transduction histidine kinase/ActR/RegA family two-component response regulator
MLKLYGTIAQFHDPSLVILAAGVCLLACYTAFSMMARLYAPKSRAPWVIAAAVVTGCGAWATHSIALLAFQPGVPVSYDVGATVLSGLLAIAGCSVAFYVARTSEQMALGGALVGFTIGAMHYFAMTGVHFQAQVQGDVLFFEAAVLTGASFGAAALSRAQLMPDVRGRIVSALLLTAGICGTHFIGIAGLTIVPDANIVIQQDTLVIVWFAIALTAVVLLILGLGIVGNLVDQHIQNIEAAKRDLEATLALAEAANQAKSEFVATVSHELRTPLNAVIGFSELMVKEVFGQLGHPSYKDYAKDIHESGSHLLQVINDILDISKAEAGNLTLNESDVNCGELINASCRLFRPRLRKSELALDLSVPDRLPTLRADARMVKQIVLNLLGNAVKFTPAGGSIRVEASADAQTGLVIIIRDTGVGIAKADLARVRQPFVQGDNSRSRRHEGTGLGLSIVERMVRQHGGSFELESEEAKGTMARVLFPATRLVWSEADQRSPLRDTAVDELDRVFGAPVPTATGKASATIDGARVLVVDDDRDLCDLLQRMLNRAGFATIGASNGHEAVAVLMNEPIQLVITDIAMPEMDGIELMRTLKKARPDLPIIALSGVEDVMEYNRIAAHLGARVALRKPVMQNDLISAVTDALGRARSPAPRLRNVAH